MTPLAHIVTILASLPLVHFLPRRWRVVALSVIGALFMFFLVPASFWIIAVTILEAALLERILRNRSKKSLWRQYLPYVLLLNFFSTDLANEVWTREHLATAGVAFAVVRVFMTTKQLLGSKSTTVAQRTVSLVAGGFFLPALVVGPVFSGTLLWDQSAAGAGGNDPVGSQSTESMYRKLFSGWLLATLVSEWFYQLTDGPDLHRITAPLVMLGLFGFLFTAFWGQSLIAEAGAALAGFAIPHNFDRPWMATDIRDFWNRWHISMSKFVTQYVFLPLNLRGVKAQVATVTAFVFMGMWHEVKPGYIIWGFAHGLLMVFAPKAADLNGRVAKIANRIVTLSVVVSLSYVANYAFK